MEKNNTYVKLILRIIKDNGYFTHIDYNRFIENNNKHSKLSAILKLPDLILNIKINDVDFLHIERLYYKEIENNIKDYVINNLNIILTQVIKNINTINKHLTIDYKMLIDRFKHNMIAQIKTVDYKNLYHLSSRALYRDMFRKCNITPDFYNTILDTIEKNIFNGNINE